MAILVIGATGNVGSEVVRALLRVDGNVIAAVSSGKDIDRYPEGKAVLFDFGDPSTWETALDKVDKVFLMRPPAIADVKNLLFPFIDEAMRKGIKQIVFLSLQGVQFNPLTPHYKVEKHLRKIKAPYTFLRPNFFMQNLTTFYRDDISNRDEIYLPASRGKTAFIDVRDIGEVAAKVLTEKGHIGKAYTLSGSESLDYYEVALILTDVLDRKIVYKNPSVGDYVKRLKDNGADETFIKVQKMLYFVVRHNFSSASSTGVVDVLGREPISFRKFAADNATAWQK